MKVFNFFLLLTCVALTPSLISSNFLFYGSNNEGTALINTYGSEVCPREEDQGLTSESHHQSFAVGVPAMSIDEILGIASSHPFENLDQGGLLWENGQAVVEGIEEVAESMVEKVQEGFVAPMIEKAEEAAECVEMLFFESYEDFLQFYKSSSPWFDEAADDEECVEEAEGGEAAAKTQQEADLTEEEEGAVVVVVEEFAEQELAPVAENASASLQEDEREKVLRMIHSIVSVGFLGSIALAYLAVASIMYIFLKDYLDEKYGEESKQDFYEMLTQLRQEKEGSSRKSARKALPAPKTLPALPAPPKKNNKNKKKKDQGAQSEEALPWPLDGECSSETNVSMEDVSQSCA